MTSSMEHEKCIKCGRRLHCVVSRRRGYGWGCWARIRKARKLAALVNFTRQQIEQAVELIEDVALIPAAILGVFYAVSSDGTEVYTTSLETCSCPSSKDCYHQAAVLMVTG
jgi:hypothetical protein